MKTAVFVSPHLDDVALSCGGLVHRLTRQGTGVMIVTIFTGEVGSPPASPLIEHIWGLTPLPDWIDRRRIEDFESCRLLGATPLHLAFLDAPFRTHGRNDTPLYPTGESLFSQPSEVDQILLEAIANRLANLKATESDFYAPLGLGSHVDHILVRNACEQVFSPDLTYYEDYPYVENIATLGQTVQYPTGAMYIEVLNPTDLNAKIASVLCYETQIPLLFGNRDEAAHRLRRWMLDTGGERYVRLAPTTICA